MHPILLQLGPVTLYSYGAMLALAFLVGAWVTARAVRTWPAELVAIPSEQVMDVTGWLLAGGMVGARLFYVVLDWRFYLRAPWEVFAIWRGGLIWYGGFLGSVLVAYGVARTRGIAFLRLADQFSPAIALGHAIGRIGCFLNGCCSGRPTTSWCGLVFPGHAQAVWPTQLFEAIGLGFLYIALRQRQQPAVLRHPGRVFGSYLVLYGILRFGLEFLRGDQLVGWAGLTLQQLVSLGVILAGLIIPRTSHPTPHT